MTHVWLTCYARVDTCVHHMCQWHVCSSHVTPEWTRVSITCQWLVYFILTLTRPTRSLWKYTNFRLWCWLTKGSWSGPNWLKTRPVLIYLIWLFLENEEFGFLMVSWSFFTMWHASIASFTTFCRHFCIISVSVSSTAEWIQIQIFVMICKYLVRNNGTLLFFTAATIKSHFAGLYNWVYHLTPRIMPQSLIKLISETLLLALGLIPIRKCQTLFLWRKKCSKNLFLIHII